MPELPEVEIITRELKKEIVGKTIKSVEIIGTYKVHPSRETFVKALINTRIVNVERISKVIVIKLSNGSYLTFHLAMTGRLLYRDKGHRGDSFLRVKLTLSQNKELRFCDLRMFGYAKIVKEDELDTLKEKYGPTPFHKDLTPEKLLELFSNRKVPIKKLLLDQEVLSGIGNIYANDSLWIAKIHPETLAHKITINESKTLLDALREILKEGLEHGGSTIKDFVDIYGNPGTQQNYFRVYGKEGKPCINCTTIIEVKMIAGRSTYFCPTCQKIEKLTLF